MSGKKTMIGDEMIETQLNEYSKKLNISVDELIERYIKRGLYSDNHYLERKVTLEELDRIHKLDMERDRKNGIPPKKHNPDVFINRLGKLRK